MICSIFLCHFVFLWSNHSYIYLYFHTIMSASPSLKSSHSQMVFIIGVLKNFAIFTGTHLCWMQFLRAFRPATLLKRDSNSFFIEYLWWLLLFIETFFSVSFLFSFFFFLRKDLCLHVSGLSRLRYHPRKSRKRRLGWVMKSRPLCKVAWAAIACAKF